MCTEGRPCEEAAGTWPSAGQGEGSGETNTDDPLILDFQVPELSENNFCCSGDPVFGISLGQP